MAKRRATLSEKLKREAKEKAQWLEARARFEAYLTNSNNRFGYQMKTTTMRKKNMPKALHRGTSICCTNGGNFVISPT